MSIGTTARRGCVAVALALWVGVSWASSAAGQVAAKSLAFVSAELERTIKGAGGRLHGAALQEAQQLVSLWLDEAEKVKQAFQRAGSVDALLESGA